MHRKAVARIAWFLAVTVRAAVAVAQISIPAVVVDGSGQTVHGLQKSDFVVHCGKCSSFDSIDEVRPLKFSNFADPIPIFILFDAISIQERRQSDAERTLLNYLRKAADEHLAVTLLATTTNGVQVVHDMSTDSKVFTAAMDRVSPKTGQEPVPASSAPSDFTKAVDEEAAQLRLLTQPLPVISPDNYKKLMSLQLESLRMVGKMLQHAPRRKPLVWISGSFPARVDKGELAISYSYLNRMYSNSLPESRSESLAALHPAFEAAVDSLNDARVSLYPLGFAQGSGYNSHPSNFETKSATAATAEAIAAQSSNGSQYRTGIGFLGLATATGGKVLGLSDGMDFASVMADLRQHFDSYYLLRFTPKPARKTTWVESSVRINKSDMKIAVADGFFSSQQ